MKINIGHIPEDGLNLHFEKDGEWFKNALPEKEKEEFSVQRADVVCSVRKLRDTVFVDGSLETTVATDCCRCLEIADFPVTSNFRYTFTPVGNQPGDEQELHSEDLEFGFYEDDIIDLDDLLFEQIMLQIPIRVLCKETCKGLCPHCGTNLNTAKCNCQTEVIDERLAVLKKFKKEG
jgi:uncharacterized protein